MEYYFVLDEEPLAFRFLKDTCEDRLCVRVMSRCRPFVFLS